MEMKTISKLLTASIFALTASASQAAPDVTVGFTWNTDPNSFGFQHGDYWPHENHEAYTSAHNNKYKMWSVGGVTDPLVTQSFVTGKANEVRWGYGGQKSKAIDYTRRSGSDDYRTSGLVINEDRGSITFWNNFLDEDFYTLTFVTLNVSFTVEGVTFNDSFKMYLERENEKLKKNGAVDVDHGGSFLIFDAELTFVHEINGVSYTFTFADLMITDYLGKDITTASLSNDCDYGLSSCYIIGGKVKSGSKDTMYTISFGNVITTAVPEPETYAMLLAGLGMIGMVSRRRRNAIRN
jgi:hypothetical protein